jgi:predicted lactoylglutathione lyase
MRLFPALSSLTLGVRSLPEATAFYEKLGWKHLADESTSAASVFVLNNVLLILRADDVMRRDLSAGEARDPLAACGQNYGDPPSVSAALERAREAGATILREAGPEVFAKRSEGARGVFSDPDGHVWDIVYDPRRMPSADGSVMQD